MDFILFIKFLTCILFLVKSSKASNQAFLQVNNELRYLAEETAADLHENLPDDVIVPDLVHPAPIRFEPVSLQFGHHAVGMPRSEMVLIFNPSTEHSLSLRSISGNTRHFHCTFFKNKLVPPLGNTSLDVVFLGREIGPVTSQLVIHTSAGSFQYQVKAEGVPNPYGLKPFVGVQIPLHSVFSSQIVMYNPHRSPLQVVEMYSTGGDLQLELPEGSSGSSAAQWRLGPFTERTLMRANFVGRRELNHTAFIRIRTNHTAARAPYLVIPVEVEVTSGSGLLSPLQRLDFGVTTRGGRILSLCVPVYNGGQVALTLRRVFVSPDNLAVRVKFEPRVIPANSFRSVSAARVLFNPDLVTDGTQLSGTVVLEYGSNGQTLELPYSAEILRGSLLHDPSLLMFTPADLSWRSVSVSSTFPAPLAVRNVTLSPSSMLQLDWRTGIVLPVNQSVQLFSVRLRRPPEGNGSSRSNVVIHTNVSDISVPVWFYSGKITVFTLVDPPPSSTLRFSDGTVAASRVSAAGRIELGAMLSPVDFSVSLFLANENPVSLHVQRWSVSGEESLLQPLAVCPTAALDFQLDCLLLEPSTHQVVLEPGWYLKLVLSVRNSGSEGRFHVNCSLETDHETSVFSLSYSALRGRIESRAALPSLSASEDESSLLVALDLRSTFSDKFTVYNVSVVSDRNAGRISGFSHDSGGQSVELHPLVWTNAGRLLWRNPCSAERNSSDVNCPRGGGRQEECSVDFDWLLCQQRGLLCFGEEDRALWANSSLLLATSLVSALSLPVSAVFNWPRLAAQRDLTFPLTQVGGVSCQNLSISNPSELSVSVQPMLLENYPCTACTDQLLRHILGRRAFGSLGDSCCSSSRDPFAVVAVEETETECSEDLLQAAPVEVALAPRETRRFLVVFLPRRESEVSGFLLLRNNLTVLEALALHARGARSHLVVSDRHGNSTIMFKLPDRSLKQCVSSSLPSSLYTVRRMITLQNAGEVAVSSVWPEIDGHRCFHAGFRVLECTPLSVRPNGSVRLTLLFAPDFSLSTVRRELVLRHADGHVDLTLRLVGTVAPCLLTPCARALPRPIWEPLLRYCTLGCALLLVLAALLAAVLDSERIIAEACTSPRPAERPAAPPALLDLSAVAKDLQAPSSSLRRASVTPVSSPAPNRAQLDPLTLRRRQAKKEAKSRRATQSWTSTLLTSLGMSSSERPGSFTVIEDVACTQSPPRPTLSGQRALSREQSEDRGSSTTDRSCPEENIDKAAAMERSAESQVLVTRSVSASPASACPRPVSCSLSVPLLSEQTAGVLGDSDKLVPSLELPYKPRSDVRQKPRRLREQVQSSPSLQQASGTTPVLPAPRIATALSAAVAPVRRVATVRPHVNTAACSPHIAKTPRVIDSAKDSSFAKIVSGETLCEMRAEEQQVKPFSEVDSASVSEDGASLRSATREYPGVIGHSRRAGQWTSTDLIPGEERSSLGLGSLNQLADSSLFGPWSWSARSPLHATSSSPLSSGDVWLGADPATRGSSSDVHVSSQPGHWSPLHSDNPHQGWRDIYRAPDN